MYVNPDGAVLPCCVASWWIHLGNVQEHSIEDIWNNQQYKQLRLDMLNGIESKSCESCYKNEAIGIKSARQGFNQKFKEYIPLADKTNKDGSLDQMELHYFDVRWSNICNFKCRSCASTYSSSWATEDKKKDIFIFAGGSNNDNLYDQFVPHLSGMKEIYFAGGEPLLTDKHYEILEHLIATGNTNVHLRYNTNLSILRYKNKNVIDLWSKFNNIDVFASLDSWGERAEYIREGTVWADIESNIKLIRQQVPHVNLQISSVVSVFNVATFDKFIDYVVDQGLFDIKKLDPSFYNIQHPEHFSFDTLPDDFKKSLADQLEIKTYNASIDRQIKSIVNQLRSSQFNNDLKDKLIQSNQHFDSIRNRNFKKTFPEYESLF